MTHQLTPNTYCILSPAECQKWFEWAKDNGIETYSMWLRDENVLKLSHTGELITFEPIDLCGGKEIPANEFLSRLQGKWQTDEVSVKLPREAWETVLWGIDAIKDKYEDASFINVAIKEQLDTTCVVLDTVPTTVPVTVTVPVSVTDTAN